MKAQKAILTKTGNVRILGRLVWPNLLKPKAPKGQGPDKARYSTALLVPNGSDLAELDKLVVAAKVEKFGAAHTKIKFKSTISRTADNPKLSDYADEFPVVINLSANVDFKPPVVDRDRADVTDPAEIYGGRWAFVSALPWAWSHETGGKGVSVDLKAVQLMDDDDAIGGGGSVNVDDEFEAAGSSPEDILG